MQTVKLLAIFCGTLLTTQPCLSESKTSEILREQTFSFLSTLAHEAGHALVARGVIGRTPEMVIGMPVTRRNINSNDESDNELAKLPLIPGLLVINSLGFLGGYTLGNPKDQRIFAENASFKRKLLTYAAGPICGTIADFALALLAEAYENKEQSMKVLLQKALDRAAPAMINQLANLFIPLPGSDGFHILSEAIPNRVTAFTTSIALSILGYALMLKLYDNIDQENITRYFEHRLKPAAFLFLGTEAAKIVMYAVTRNKNLNPKKTLEIIAENPRTFIDILRLLTL